LVKIVLKAGKDAVEQAEKFGDFEKIKPGTYRMVVAEINAGHSKGDDGKPDKKRPRLEFVLKPFSEDREGKVKFKANYGQLWDYCRLDEDVQEAKRAQWAIALGATPNRQGNVSLSIENEPDKPGTDIGKHVIARVKAGENQEGDYKPEIANVWPVKAGAEGDEAFDEEGEDDAEEEDEGEEEDSANPFGDEDEAEDDELLTADSLEAMDLKELGGIAGEFDLDPKEHIVRNRAKKVDSAKTKKALIDAILEAQGAEPDFEEDNSEDPF